ncbi:PTS sugar transporter subunit IIA [Desulfitobacterium sp. AusDCA]|uniref:PTS sugar transporter subunit IIA n=1 Tax=Desulfitobacterium sp. AusDCA TaxID=3240383 RepID=UPI003DA6FE3B
MSISQGLSTSQDVIVVKFQAENRQQVIKELGKRAAEKKYVQPEFVADVLSREENFPTGLEMQIPIALPHIGTHCNQSFLSLAILESPVAFNAMDGSGNVLNAELVFLFGITNPDDQVEVLKKFIFAFRERANLEKLKAAENPEMALEVLKGLLTDDLIID